MQTQRVAHAQKNVKRKVASSCPSGDEVFLALFPSIAIMLIYHGWQQYLKKKHSKLVEFFNQYSAIIVKVTFRTIVISLNVFISKLGPFPCSSASGMTLGEPTETDTCTMTCILPGDSTLPTHMYESSLNIKPMLAAPFGVPIQVLPLAQIT